MTPSTELFDLIQSLGQAEKRYFKIYTQKHVIGGENNYLKLFNLLVKMKKYEEVRVKKKFKGTRIARDLASEKHYLKELIMRAMRAFHSDKSVEIRLLGLLQDLHFLWEKNLTYQFRRTLDRTWKLAYEHEHFYTMLRVLEYRRLLHKSTTDKHIEEGMETILAKMQETIQRLAHELEYGHLYERMYLKTQQRISPQDKEKMKEIDAFLAHPLLQNEEMAQSFTAGIYYNNIKANYHLIKGELEREVHFKNRILEIWEAHPKIQKEQHSRYRRTLSNYITGLFRLGKHAEILPVIEKIRNSAGTSLLAKAEKFELGHFSEQLFLLGRLDFDAAEKLAESIEKGLDTYGKRISSGRQFSFIYNNMVVFLFLEKWSQALRRLNRILNAPGTEHRKDIQAMARVYLQMIHYELGNVDILDNLNRSAKRFMSKEETERSFEARVLKFFRKLIDVVDEGEVKDRCEAFHAELQEGWPPTGGRPLGFDELSHWLESKFKGIPMRETIG